MGLKAVLIIFIAWAFSFFIIMSDVLPTWITTNDQLYLFTVIIWFIGFVLAFYKFGFEE